MVPMPLEINNEGLIPIGDETGVGIISLEEETEVVIDAK